MSAASDKILDAEELAERMRNLDPLAWEQFADYFGRRLRFYFLRKGLAECDAEDLTADCMYKIPLAVPKRYQQRDNASFSAWVYKLAFHAHINFLRERKIPTISFDETKKVNLGDDEKEAEHLQLISHNSDDFDPQRLELTDLVQKALSQLSPTDQEIIHLRDLESPIKYKQLSESSNTSPGALRIRRKRAMERLQAILEKDPEIQRLLKRP